eukprot:NODE_994_length_1516_cov_139.898488_g983_i0.p1 GENE.NODE_994_length_1516_cov_139.898488_g983_i0~~NODE_994_length_1516_cov_139.898488_g983_i0.p1  ORF type:complete len:459 (+),score=94.70 NODE_994_length_1516_cov_139.898488_g983_i0:55-1431(+)
MAGSPCVSFFFRQQLPLFKEIVVPRKYVSNTLAKSLKFGGLAAASPLQATFTLSFQAGSANESRMCNGNMYVFQKAVSEDPRVQGVIAKTGALISCHAGRETSNFTVQCRPEDASTVAAVLADCIQKPPNAEAVARVAQAALDGFYDEEMDPLVRTKNHLHDQCYQMHPLGNTPSGTTDGLRNVTGESVAEFVSDNLTSARAALTVVSEDPEALGKLIAKEFEVLAEGEAQQPQYNRYIGGQQTENNEWYPYTHRSIAFRTNGWAGEDNLKLSLLQHMWGKWSKNDGIATASRPGRVAAVSYDQHAFIGLDSFNYRYRSTGLVGVTMKEKPNKSNWDRGDGYGQREIVKTLTSTTHLLNNEELDTAKSQFKTDVLRRRDNPVSCTQDMGEQLLNIDAYAYADMNAMFQAVNDVTVDNIMDTCENFLHYADHAISAVGCHSKPNDYGQWMRHETRFWRM